MIVLDTHVLIWVTQQPEKIGQNCAQLIEQAWLDRSVAVSAVSLGFTSIFAIVKQS